MFHESRSEDDAFYIEQFERRQINGYADGICAFCFPLNLK